MFGGPNKNPFGSSTFGKESTPRPVTARKRGKNFFTKNGAKIKNDEIPFFSQ